MSVTARAAALRADGRDVIGLSAGEPDFDTPEPIREAAVAAIRAGETRYTPVPGTDALRDAVAAKLARENGLHYGRDEVMVSTGAKQCLYNLAAAVLDAGDEAIIQAPYWVSYPDIVRLVDGVPEIVETDERTHFRLTPDTLDAAVSDRTRLLILNSPANPTGIAYTRDELAALGEVLQGYPDVLVASDDIYEHIHWGGAPFANIVNACPALRERTVVINGVSKAYAMTGWRIGYAAGPAPVITAMARVQSQSTSCASSVSQAAALAALEHGGEAIAPMREAFRRRHDLLVSRLDALPGVRCRPAEGTFYCFPDCRRLIRELPQVGDDTALAEWLLEHAEVAVVPGSAFGLPGRLRFSFATSEERLSEAVDRIERCLAEAL